MKRIEHVPIPVIAGIWPLTSLRNAEFMKNELRVPVPDSILAADGGAATPKPPRPRAYQIAREMLESIRMLQGAQISAPMGKYSSAVDVLEVLGECFADSSGGFRIRQATILHGEVLSAEQN